MAHRAVAVGGSKVPSCGSVSARLWACSWCTYIDFSVCCLGMKEAHARQPVDVLEVSIQMFDDKVLPREQLLRRKYRRVDGQNKVGLWPCRGLRPSLSPGFLWLWATTLLQVRRYRRNGIRGSSSRHGRCCDRSRRRRRICAFVRRCCLSIVVELALGWRVLALQASILTSLASRQLARTLCLLRVTLATGSLSSFADCASFGVAL